MTADTPACGRTGDDTEALAEVLADVFDEWLHRMHGVTSSCRHAAEGEALAGAVLTSDWLAARDARVAADAVAGVLTLADEWERTGERLIGVPAAQTWLLVSARLRAVVAPHTDTEEGDRG